MENTLPFLCFSAPLMLCVNAFPLDSDTPNDG